MENNNVFAPIVREFLASVAQNEAMGGKKYSERIEINDGGCNSYIGLNVDVDKYNKSRKDLIQCVRLYRHSNSVSHLVMGWQFELGGVCNPYCDNPEIPIEFRTQGISVEDAEKEARMYFEEMLKLIRKSTSDMKIAAAESAEKERDALLARLEELNHGGNAIE